MALHREKGTEHRLGSPLTGGGAELPFPVLFSGFLFQTRSAVLQTRLQPYSLLYS